MTAWGELEHSVRTGEPSFEKVTGRSVFAHMAGDPELLPVFTEAMAEGSRMAAPGVVASRVPPPTGFSVLRAVPA
ncbi:MAG: hypothetical protein ACRDRK_09190 [Pseudonocardia sp.]